MKYLQYISPLSCTLHNLGTHFRLLLAVIVMMMGSTGVWGADYVFEYNGNFLGVNAAGTAIQNYTTFNPTCCIWTCDEGLSTTTSHSLYVTIGGTKHYLFTNTTDGNTVSTQTGAWANWRSDGTRLYYPGQQNNRTYYLYYRDNSWRTSRTQGRNNNNTSYQGGLLTGYADYRATQTASSTAAANDQTTAPTISYSSRTATTITLSRTDLGGTYTPTATTIVVSGTTYFKGSNGVYSTTAPSVNLNPTYTWSVTSGNASITQDGVVTPNNNITNNITVRLTTTNANPALTKTTDYTINVASTSAATTYSGGLNAVTPANSRLNYNTNTAISLNSPARKKNATPAYQTYTASGNTFYRVNNAFQDAAPTSTSTDVVLNSYSWNLSGVGASNSQLASATGTTNTLTYNSAAASDVTVTINVTANYAEGGDISKTAEVTLIQGVCATPAITQNDNQITFNCSYPASGVTIYYTTNGSTPSTSNGAAVSSGSKVTVPYNTTVKAIATAAGYEDSDVVEHLVADKPSGSGTQADPYIISSPSHLNDFSKMVDNEEAGKYYKVTANISVSSYTAPNTDFTGTFDGGYFIIDGLTEPLVKSANGATIKNVILDNVSLTSSVTVSGTTCLGAIAAYASGNTKIYNCGVQASGSTFDEKRNLVSSSSIISGGDNTGSLVGYVTGNVRVVNNYSYASVSGSQYVGGIVGRNNGTALSNSNYSNTSHSAIALNMFYGDLRGSGNVSPVYAGNHTSNVQNVNEYNYWRSRANVSYNNYNNQLAVDKNEFLNRFPFYRHILNTHRELAAIYLFGSRTDANVAEIGHWYNAKNKPDGLGGIDNPTPYPIIEKWLTNTKRTTEDIKNNLPNTGNEYEGNLITAADRSGKTVGSNGYLRVNWTVHGKSGSIDLPITDMDSLNYDFTWGKVVLPFATELAEKDTYANICTGWKITGITGGTAGSLTNYNFSDRDCTAKDLYSNSNYIFAQGGNYIVPYGVTAITIEGNMAKAFYLRDASYDVGYDASYGGATALAGTISGNYHGQTVYTSLSTLLDAMGTATTPHTQAIVLVGNYHYNQNTIGGNLFSTRTGKGLTIMSVDEDNNQEPDYGWYSYHTTDRTAIPPMRFDFVPNIGIGMAARTTGSNAYPTIGIWHSRGWFELTETCVSIMNECEINDGSFTNTLNINNRWIINSGYFLQIVRARSQTCNKLAYIQIGGNAYVEQLYPGPHVAENQEIALCPINVTGGEVEECFMTGKGSGTPNATGANIFFWCAGGRIHKYLSAYMVKPSTAGANVTAKVDHARILRFFGGGTSSTAPITGNINVTMNNSLVDFYCGGPEFGNMTTGKTVTTNATGSTFGQFYGAGFGGTSITWVNKTDATVTFNGDITFPGAFTNYTNDRLKYDASRGFGSSYDFEYIQYSGGGGQGVARFYTGYSDFSLAQTGNVTSNLTNCTVLNSFYGGGCQGTVAGNATSTLTSCHIEGNAFAGGYKAPETTVDVYTTTQPTYSVYKKETGIFSDFGTVAPEKYTWQHGTAGQKNEAQKILYTAVSFDDLGAVTGKATINILGDTYVAGLIDGQPTGGVFGGGNESPVRGQTEVNINSSNAYSIANVYGGANMADVGGATTVNVTSGTIGNVFGANNQSGTKAQSVVVNISQAADAPKTIINNVYGGGNLAAYTFTETPASPAVNMTSGTVNQNVFGGGLGVTAIVTGSPTVTIDGGNVNGSVYGGGALANVAGDTYVILNGGEVGEDVFGGGMGELNDDGTAKTYANISGDTHVTANGTTFHFPEDGIDPDVNHNIYGGGNLACKVNASNVTINAGILEAGFMDGGEDSTWGKYLAAVAAQDDNVMQGSVFGGGYGVNTTVNTTATVNVNVAADATNKAMVDVVGGGYNGYVLNKTDVIVAGASEIYKVYGGGLGSYEGYNTAPESDRSHANISTFTMQQTIGSVGEGKEGDGTNVTINGGKIYSNIYGGGAGLQYDDNDVSYLNVAEVFGKSHVTIDAIAGWTDTEHAFSHNVYGGGALGLVNDEILVEVKSGTMEGAEVFAGSLGEKGHLDKAKVTKVASVKTLANATAGTLQGHFNIYGGCDMAQMGDAGNPVNTDVDIKHGTFSGSIFGAGKGLYSEYDADGNLVNEYLDYGKVIGNTTIVIDAPNIVLGKNNDDANDKIKIYGGGALGLVEGTINPVTLKSGELYGDVFGGSLGELGHPNKAKIVLTDPNSYLGVLTTASSDNKDGEKPAALNGNINIYGGCDMAVVEGNTQVEITHGTFTGQMFGGGKGVATVFEGEGDAKHDIYADHGKVVGETTIIYNNDGTFNGNVYGGGALGSVIPATVDTDGSTTTIKLMKGILNGHVFGGGFGEKTNVEKAKVVGNTFITTREMDDPADVLSGEMNHIYGGGDMAMVDGNTNLDFTRGKFNGEIFGGGHGIEEEEGTEQGEEQYQDFGKVTGKTHVVIDGGQLGTNNDNEDEKIRIYGGGALGLVGGIDIVVKSGTHYGEVFGGSLGEFGHPGKAIVSGNSFVSTVANDPDNPSPLTGNIKFYGGCNQSQVTGNSSVTINYGDFSGAIFGGGKGVSGSDEYGKIGGNASVLMMAGDTKDADVYGGCALGVVAGNTTVDLAGGKVKDVYGGGLGDAQTAAYVNGDAKVTLNGSKETGATNDCKVYGSIFGCNNVNGTPKGDAYVHIKKTYPKGTDGEVYHVAAVYGGGNNAAYRPETNATGTTNVYVEDCENSIEYVYGGGNAAPVPATLVTIDGGNTIGNVFGGGNGKGDGNPGADVGYLGYYSSGNYTEYGAGTATTVINGGKITNVYGGSNTLGYIRTKASVSVEQQSDCELDVENIFAAGNQADMFCDGEINIGCIEERMEQIFGGSNNANIRGNISLNLTNGSFGQVFGGNNEGGNIEGSITVNIDETGCKPIIIDELYCCGNQAAYSIYGYKDDGSGKFVPRTKEEFDAMTADQKTAAGFEDGNPKADPTLNIISFTSIGSIFGGGLGEKAAVYGNTNININPIPGKYAAAMATNEKYGVKNDNEGKLQSEQALPENKHYTTENHGIIGNIYGGGSEAMVYGNTNITIGSMEHNSHVTGDDDLKAKTYNVGVNITGDIYGGGKKAKVTGDTNVKVGK